MRATPTLPTLRQSLSKAAILLITASWPGAAEADCDRQQRAAEAGLRWHTEIMVASLLCNSDPKAYSGPQGPYALYRLVTARHSRIIGLWEQQIASKAGLERFDTWRTELANDVTRADLQKASMIGIDAYCAYAKRVIDQAMRLSSQEVLARATPEPSASVACTWIQTSETAR